MHYTPRLRSTPPETSNVGNSATLRCLGNFSRASSLQATKLHFFIAGNKNALLHFRQQNCTSSLQARKLHFFITGKDLNRGIRCIHNYTRHCLTEEMRMHFNQLYDGTTRVIQKLCQPGPYQQEFLSHAPCMRKVTTDYEACADRYQKKVGEVHQRINEQSKRPYNESATERMARENELRTVCCSFRDYLMCSQNIVRDRCGEKTANFTQDFLNQMSVSLIQVSPTIFLCMRIVLLTCFLGSAFQFCSQSSPRLLLHQVTVVLH
ncbi:hypothetical protein C0J52_02126 [Blattella germanica]|nr:hypothetical protein C0J52_02126 [Blattella germanica]